jgi:UDP-N-acetylmuramoyl-L-alanyl-D-glutamate--2,6-diaminopimelate ligase
MTFNDLLRAIEPVEVRGDTGVDIRGLFYDSRRVESGGLFFALRGQESDGHGYVGAALRAGAAALVVEEIYGIPNGIPCVRVADSRLAMARMAALFYGNPSDSFPLVGITGTNGKTTTSFMIEGILDAAAMPAAVLGTVNYRFRDKIFQAPHTTPESVELQKLLSDMLHMGAKAAVMEVSSHALDQRRVDGCRFDVGVFTNLTRDHLDYHREMELYLASKKRLFSELLAPDEVKPLRRAAVNLDDPYGKEVAAASSSPVISYGLGPDAKVTATDVIFSMEGITGRLVTPVGDAVFRSRMPGRFNLYNILAATAAGIALELPLSAIIKGIEGHRKVPGRLETVENELGIGIFVDYAHTGDALENVLKTLSELATKRIITVFGCGGDRDRGKRPVMGGVAGSYSDIAIITSDNPRTEEPASIMAEIEKGIIPLGTKRYKTEELTSGFREKGYTMVESRREAISLAVTLAESGDILLIAGKGHEDYQIIGTERFHFDDREEASSAIQGLRAT